MEISNFRTKPNRLKRRLKKRAMFVRDRCVNINTFIFALAILRARANIRGGRRRGKRREIYIILTLVAKVFNPLPSNYFSPCDFDLDSRTTTTDPWEGISIDRSIDRKRESRDARLHCPGIKVAYIIEHPFHAPTINDTHYVRNRRFKAGTLFVLFECRFLGACRAASRHSSTPDR